MGTDNPQDLCIQPEMCPVSQAERFRVFGLFWGQALDLLGTLGVAAAIAAKAH